MRAESWLLEEAENELVLTHFEHVLLFQRSLDTVRLTTVTRPQPAHDQLVTLRIRCRVGRGMSAGDSRPAIESNVESRSLSSPMVVIELD